MSYLGPWKDRITNWGTVKGLAHPNYSNMYAASVSHRPVGSVITSAESGYSGYSGYGAYSGFTPAATGWAFMDCISTVTFSCHNGQNLVKLDKYITNSNVTDECITLGSGLIDHDDSDKAVNGSEISQAMHQPRMMYTLHRMSATYPTMTPYVGYVNSAQITQLGSEAGTWAIATLLLNGVSIESLTGPDGTACYKWTEQYIYNPNTWYKFWLKRGTDFVLHHLLKNPGSTELFSSTNMTWVAS